MRFAGAGMVVAVSVKMDTIAFAEIVMKRSTASCSSGLQHR